MKKTLRVAVVIPKYGLTGGAENFVAELTGRLAQNTGYEFHVLANQWTAGTTNIRYHKIPIISFPKFLTTISFAYFVERTISKMDFDLIHTHDRIFNADIYTMHGIPHRIWIHEVRGKKRLSLFDWGTAWVEKTLVGNERCRKFLAVSKLTRDKFLQEYGEVSDNRIEILHPGIDITRFQKYDRERCRKDIRERFSIGQDEIILLFVSMNFDIRGLDLLINGLACLKQKRPTAKIRLLAVGKGDEKKYRLLARNLGIEEWIVLTGVADTETLEKIYLAADLFSILSQFDTFSMAVLEAMAASLPVIISSNVGAKDLIRQGVNGFIIDETGNLNSIANKIELLLDGSVRQKMAAEAFQTASLQTWSAAVRKMEGIYSQIIKDRNSACGR